jgi:hypothetical protein
MTPELGLLTPSRPGRTWWSRTSPDPVDTNLDTGQPAVAGELTHPVDELRLEEPHVGRDRRFVTRDDQAVVVDVDRPGASGHRVTDDLRPPLEHDLQPRDRRRGAEGSQGAIEDLTQP